MKIASLKKVYLLIGISVAGECGLVGAIGIWREYFWASISGHQYHDFLVFLGYFIVAAMFACLLSGYSQYLVNYAALIKRHRLTRAALKLKHETHVENIPQRIQEDCMSYNQLSISLVVNGLKNAAILTTYCAILWYQLSGLYLILPILYVVIGTYIASKIAKPLISLNYINQNFEARFRQFLTGINYAAVHRNNHNLFKSTKYLAYFQSFYNQFTVVVPYLLLAPIYFTYKISFGVLMQCSASIHEIIGALSYGINSFNEYNKWLSCRKRLREINLIK